ncbi:MAG: DnaJ domain-containing protein [Thermoleophilia bacterium]|jgi:curved DNA-binding protein|nr:DnaJ domain-containing protein [Thermoleophilia bacterium]
MRSAGPDHYAVLGIDRDADQDAVRRAYRRLARRHHPDVSADPDAEERFKEVNEAYQVLSDPERRAAYDHPGAGRAAEAPPGPPPGGGAVWTDGGDDDLQDLFAEMFGGGQRYRARGPDVEADLEVGLEEAARGGEREIRLPGGRALRVRVPQGASDGQRIRLAGQGGSGIGDGPPGDLYLRLRLLPHPRFRAEGRDLEADLPVSPWEAVLGAGVEAPTLTGTARVRVPAGSSSGRRLRLRGQGLPGPDGPGDLYLTVSIRVPREPTARERELFEALAAESSFDPRGAG